MFTRNKSSKRAKLYEILLKEGFSHKDAAKLAYLYAKRAQSKN